MKTALDSVLEASTPEAMLRSLLDAWRERRLARTAELVVLLGGRIASRPPKAKSGADAEEKWHRAAAARDPRDLAWLCKGIVHARRDESIARLAEIAKWPADPRLSLALLDLVPARPHASAPSRPFWTQVFRLLAKRADETVSAKLDTLLRGEGVADFDAYIRSKLLLLKSAIGRQPPLATATPKEATVLDAIAAALTIPGEAVAKETADQFLEAIWANPRDDGPREVFSDWLIERDDPRGEFIALQLGRARGVTSVEGTARERALLKEHARAWMGPIEPAIHRSAYRFERGFLSSCTIVWRRLVATAGLTTHPAWATVRDYELAPEGERDCDAWLDHMIALGAKRR